MGKGNIFEHELEGSHPGCNYLAENGFCTKCRWRKDQQILFNENEPRASKPSYQNILNNLDRGNMIERNGKKYLFLHGWKWQTATHVCEVEVVVPDDLAFKVGEFVEFEPKYLFYIEDRTQVGRSGAV